MCFDAVGWVQRWLKQDSAANAKGNARQQCMFEGPLLTKSCTQVVLVWPVVILAQFALKMCDSPKFPKKSIKPSFWHSRSLISVPIKSQCTTSC